MGAALKRTLCDCFQGVCPFYCPRLPILQSDVESGLMSSNTAMSKNDQKKELITSTIERTQHTEVKILRGIHVKNGDLECSTSPITVEWFGTMYSGKFGSLLSNENLNMSDEQLQIRHKAAAAQDANHFSQLNLVQHIGWTTSYSDINNYTVEQVEQMLKNTEIESEHLANLKHENIIKFYGIFCEKDKLPILIMEPIQCDLYKYLCNNQSVSWNHAFTILQGISKGLSYLHDAKNMVHCNICTISIVLTKTTVAKLTSFELAVVVSRDGTAQEEDRLMSYDVFCFGQVLLNIIQCTQHEKEQLHSLFQSMHEFAEECMSSRKRTTSSEILNTIEKYRHQYESTGDDIHNGSPHDHSMGLLERRLTKENEQLKNQVEQIKDEAKCLELKLLEIEEKNFKLTNAFTTADSRSPLKISEEYRYVQQHHRAAAARAHKKMHSKCSPVPFHEHTMIAYHKAKELILAASTQYIEKSLFDLHHQPDESHDTENVADLRGVKLMMNKLHDDHNLTVNSIDAIEKRLIEAYEDHVNQRGSIPADVKDYYTRLAKLTWNAVAKAIPMVFSTEEMYYDETVHELKDEPDDIDPSAAYPVKYIYPILFTSNNHPREVALKGRVRISIS